MKLRQAQFDLSLSFTVWIHSYVQCLVKKVRSRSKVGSSNFYGLGVCQSHGYSMINMASIKKRNWWGWEWSWEVLHVHVVILGQSKTDILIFQNSLIGFFDFNSSPQPPGFIQFYYASIRLLEKSKLILTNCMTNYYDVYKLGLASFSKILRMHSRVFTFLT